MKFDPKDNPRFVWLVGAIHEQFPDVPEADTQSNDLVLYDRQEEQAVATIHNPYAQAMCLEVVPDGAPFTALEEWFNNTSNEAFDSEGIPVTRE